LISQVFDVVFGKEDWLTGLVEEGVAVGVDQVTLLVNEVLEEAVVVEVGAGSERVAEALFGDPNARTCLVGYGIGLWLTDVVVNDSTLERGELTGVVGLGVGVVGDAGSGRFFVTNVDSIRDGMGHVLIA